MDIDIQVFVRKYVFNSLQHMCRSGISGSCGNSTFNVLRDHYFYSYLTGEEIAELGLQPRTSHSRIYALTLSITLPWR